DGQRDPEGSDPLHHPGAGDPGRGLTMYQHLLIPTDGSPLSSQAVGQALELAATLGARVTILTVVEPFYAFSASPEHLGETREQYERHARQAAEAILRDAREQAATLGVSAQVKAVGSEHPDQTI